MATRPLPARRLDSDTHSSPVRQNVALRWLNNVAPAPVASTTVRAPVKRWPPPAKVDAPPHSPVAAAPAHPAPVPVVKTVSAFQSARAMFEAKKAPPAAPPPPRRRVTPFTPAAPVVTKQHSNSSNVSSSSCSTDDSETDRKLEERVEPQHEPKPSPPVHAVENMEKMSAAVTTPAQVSAQVSPCTSKPLVFPPAREVLGPRSPSSAATAARPERENQGHRMRSEIDPFRLLLPVDAVPTLPVEVPSVYDNVAVEMEKNIKKVVRKLLKKNKARLEEFKVNSRLFGTDFMDSHAYLDTLIKDFGPIRALQLVPCLLSVQPDVLKGNTLLLTAKTYLVQHEEALRHELRELQLPNTTESAKPEISSNTVTMATLPPEAAAARSMSATTEIAVKESSSPVPTSPTEAKDKVEPPGIATERTCSTSTSQLVATATNNSISPIRQAFGSAAQSSLAAISTQEKPTVVKPVAGVKAVKNEATKPAEPMPEPQEAAPPVINIAVAGPIQMQPKARTVQVIAPDPVVGKRVEPATPSDSEEEFRAENLFGELIKASPKKKQPHKENGLDALVAPVSPASSTRSFEEAENLFGERLSSPSRSSVSRRKTVTWGETQTVEVPIERDSPAKITKKPLPLLFGPATAAAFDSDSDESDFSD